MQSVKSHLYLPLCFCKEIVTLLPYQYVKYAVSRLQPLSGGGTLSIWVFSENHVQNSSVMSNFFLSRLMLEELCLFKVPHTLISRLYW